MPTYSYDEVWYALQESVKLQAHYAELLNMHDGGHRLIFLTPEEWLARLRQLEKLAEKRGKNANTQRS